MSDNAILAALRRCGIPKEETTGHGFRATARTILDEVLNFRVDLIEHQLGHAVKDPNGRAYNRTAFLPERVAMMQQWADYLDVLKKGAKVRPAVLADAERDDEQEAEEEGRKDEEARRYIAEGRPTSHDALTTKLVHRLDEAYRS